MKMTTNPRVEEILQKAEAADNLPSPRGVALEVLHAVASDETTGEDLARIIEKDPAISSRVIKTVNTPLAGAARQVGSVQQAVGLLGFETIKAITVALSLLEECTGGQCGKFDYQGFWSESLARAVAMRHLAAHTKSMPVDEAFTYGLLSLIGRLALVSVFPEKYGEVLIVVGSVDRAELAEAEAAVFEIGTDEFSALMMRDWGMPRFHAAWESQCQGAAAASDSPAEFMCQLMHVSELVAEILVESNTFHDQITALTHAAGRLGIDADALPDLFDSVAAEWRAAGDDLSVKTRCVPVLSEIYAHAAERA